MNWKSAVTIGATLLITSTMSLAADDGAALYKSKCAGCHGAGGEGKPAMKAPALKATTWDVNQIVEQITKQGHFRDKCRPGERDCRVRKNAQVNFPARECGEGK
jgi:cytochrome c553